MLSARILSLAHTLAPANGRKQGEKDLGSLSISSLYKVPSEISLLQVETFISHPQWVQGQIVQVSFPSWVMLSRLLHILYFPRSSWKDLCLTHPSLAKWCSKFKRNQKLSLHKINVRFPACEKSLFFLFGTTIIKIYLKWSKFWRLPGSPRCIHPYLKTSCQL